MYHIYYIFLLWSISYCDYMIMVISCQPHQILCDRHVLVLNHLNNNFAGVSVIMFLKSISYALCTDVSNYIFDSGWFCLESSQLSNVMQTVSIISSNMKNFALFASDTVGQSHCLLMHSVVVRRESLMILFLSVSAQSVELRMRRVIA